MEQLEKIKTLIQPALDSLDLQLYEVQWVSEKKSRILQIAVMRPDGSMDIETCAEISEKISELLDQHEDLISTEYFLEVCSPGAERVLRSEEEIRKAVGSFVYIRLKAPIKSMMEVTGDLIEINGTLLTLSYRDKAATRKMKVEMEQLELIRLAVKL